MKKMTRNTFLTFIGMLMTTNILFAQFNVNISTNATANVSTATVGTVKTYTATATGANVQIATIFADFINGISEVKIETGTAGGSQNGDITLANPINYNGIGLGKTLTLNARNAIAINSSITDGTVGGDLLNLNMTASGLANALTAINIAAALETNGGNINLIGTNNSDVASQDNGAIYINATNMNTAGGNITLIGTALNVTFGFGIRVGGTNLININTSGGKFTMIGESNAPGRIGNTSFGTPAAQFTGSLTTNGGDINIRGEAKAKSSNGELIRGVIISMFNNDVFSSGSGNITIVGETNANDGAASVTIIGNPTNSIQTTTGNLSISGKNKNTLPIPPMSFPNKAVNLWSKVISNTGKIVINTEISNGNGLDYREPISTNGDIEINANTANPNFNTGSIGSATTGTINSGGNGKITIKVSGSSSAMSLGSSLTSNNGDITIEHLGGVGLGTLGWVFISQPIQSANGNITIRGTNTNATTNAWGVYTSTNGTITTTGTGKISITGTNTSDVPAVEINQPITSGGSDITISGTNTGTGVGVLINSTVSSTGTVGNGRVEESEAVNGELTITGANNANAPSVQINAPIQTNNNNIFITGTNKGTGANARGIFITNTINASGAGALNLIGEVGADANQAIGATVNIASNKNINIKTNKGGFNAPNIQSNGGAITINIANQGNLNVNNNILTTGGLPININFGNNGISVGKPADTGLSFVGGISNGISSILPDIYKYSTVVGAIGIRNENVILPQPVVVTAKAGSEQVTLSWKADLIVGTSYEIYMYVANQAQRLVGTTKENTFTIKGLQNNITYFFKVITIDVDGIKSDFSNTVSARPSIVLGTEEETANSKFQVYPNPNSGSFSLVIGELKGKNAQLTVLDLGGRILHQQNVATAGGLETELNLNLASGMYLLQVSTDKENLRRKLVIER